LGLMVWRAPALLPAIMLKLLNLPRGPWFGALRMAAWLLGWLIWFGGGLFSFMHALE
jgi:hypothetical protein